MKESTLNLRPGDRVRAKSIDEILSTLDEAMALEHLPFMPEMLEYCGKTYHVYKRADKTCDTINKSGGRRMQKTVHLDNLRCNGKAHGDCEASCLLFWKEVWLEKVDENQTINNNENTRQLSSKNYTSSFNLLSQSAQVADNEGTVNYKCQATELYKASSPLAWWDLRQYWRDLRTKNVKPGRMLRVFVNRILLALTGLGIGYRFSVSVYNRFQRLLGGVEFPFKGGSLKKTPALRLDLKAGELVRIKPYAEILKTLDKNNRNRGLYFDAEMVQYCGSTFRVLKRVTRIIDEKDGRMINLPNDCVILEGAVCSGDFSAKRLFCPRSIYPYWREIWLERIND